MIMVAAAILGPVLSWCLTRHAGGKDPLSGAIFGLGIYFLGIYASRWGWWAAGLAFGRLLGDVPWPLAVAAGGASAIAYRLAWPRCVAVHVLGVFAVVGLVAVVVAGEALPAPPGALAEAPSIAPGALAAVCAATLGAPALLLAAFEGLRDAARDAGGHRRTPVDGEHDRAG